MDEILCRKTKLLEMIVDLILTMYHRDQSENPNIFIYDKLNKNRLFICICALKYCFVKALHLRQPLRYRTLPDWIVIIPTGYDTLNSFCHETRTYQETITITTAQKMSAFVVFLVGIFPHYGSIWRFAILCFQSESVKIRTRKTRNMDIFYTVYLLQKKDEFCSCKLKTINFVAETLNQLWWSNQKFNKSGVIVTNFEIDYLSTRYYLNLKDDEKLFGFISSGLSK